ncbi:MAG TPA: DUF2334 domain-containing protein, partial [Verrucomicrobiae bacterium]|nr:DUF2334 domain-containing protein [Verrucomicrobiae bacterium]
MDSAKRLDLPYEFFEAPHYAILADQLNVVEQHFDYVYEHYPNVYSKVVERTAGKRKVKYIPTPLDYVDGKQDAKRMIAKIRNLPPGILGSFFYHPYIEFEDITLESEADGYPTYKYSETSVLHQLVPVFKEKGFKFLTIKDI